MTIKFAVPTVDKILCEHFGHCAQFAIVDVEDGKITNESYVTPPAHEPGLLPKWLHEQEVTIIIASGMGSRAQNLFTQNGINVFVGAPSKAPKDLVKDYLENNLESGTNGCDH